MNASTRHALLAAFAMVASSVMLVSGGQQAPPAAAGPPFTAEQAAAGRVAYDQRCGLCHGPDLDLPPRPLAGPTFEAEWNGRPVQELIAVMRSTMPVDDPGGLPEQTYVNIAAYLLQFNGMTPGAQALAVSTPALIAAGTQAPAPAAAPAAAQAAPAGGRAGGRGQQAPAPTDGRRRGEELRAGHRRDAAQPGAGRLADAAPRSRTPRATARSTQITPANAQPAAARLGLADARRRQQPAGAARLQRHDLSEQHRRHRAGARRRTGDLIWEHRLGANVAHARHGALRRQAVRGPSATRTSSRSTRARARRSGTSRCRTAAALQRAARRQRQDHPGHGRLHSSTRSNKCFISAYDAATGEQLWRFHTIARDGEPGGDTWGDLPICTAPAARPGSPAATTPS
jgi:S-disulfanyl-L-cysteine oxidoreductase SoxD